MAIQRFEDLVIWKESRQLCGELYSAFQKVNDYSFNDQLKRASVSIMNNIAEGFERGNNKEFLVFLGVAKGSAGEVRSQLHTAYDVSHLSEEQYSSLLKLSEEVSRLITGLIVSLRKSSMSGMRVHRS